MISFRDVTKIYPPETQALKDVSFEVQKGEFVSVVGRSGAGKTTLLKLLIGAEKPTAGQIFFDNQDVHRLSLDQLAGARRRIGMVFQDYKLLPSRALYENIAYILEVIGASDEEIAEEVPQVLELVGLEQRANHFPRQLSGGEHQRAAVARAIIHRPELLLADEPTGNLDPYHTKDVVHLLQKINEMGTAVILATHNRETINSLKRRVITLEEGKLIRDEQKGKFIL